MLLFLFLVSGIAADAADTGMEGEMQSEASLGSAAENAREELLGEMDFSEMDRMLEELFPGERMEFGEILQSVIAGETELTEEFLKEMIDERLFYALRVNLKSVVHLVVISIAAALFLNFSNVFQTRQVSEISFFLLYLLLVGVCLTSFQAASEWVGTGIGQLTGFMKVLYPIYFAAVTAAKGSVTSMAFYHLALLLIILVEGLIENVMLPMIHIYVIVRVLGSLQSEDYLSKFGELLELVISWIMKTLFGCMIGLNVIQGLVAPAIDSVKRSVLTRGVEAIPGVGDAIGGAAEVVIGTAVLIKNSIGLIGAVVCCVLCAAPMIQIAVVTLAYKLTAAAIQPVSDKRIVECISGVGEGARLLLRAVFTSGILFLLTIAIVAYTTSSV